MITAHTDGVGSLLRPPKLLNGRKDLASGNITQTECKAIEDWAVDEAITLQQEAGLEALTDGEMRRLSLQSQMTETVGGFGEYDLDSFLWGEWRGNESVGNWALGGREKLGVVGKLTRKRHLSAEDVHVSHT